MNNWKSHLALVAANFLYGINYVIAKGIMPIYLNPLSLVFLRVIPSMILFWLLGLFIKTEKIEKKDYLYLFISWVLWSILKPVFIYFGVEFVFSN